MMKSFSCLLALAVLATASFAQAAEDAAPNTAAAQPSKHEVQALKWFHQLDRNNDGCVSTEEAAPVFLIKPSLRRWYEETDADHDGCLTEKEVRVRAAKDKARKEARRAREAAEKARAAEGAAAN